MKFDTDYRQYSFYEPSFDNSGNTIAPYNVRSVYGEKLFNVDFALSDQIKFHERSAYNLMNLFGDIGGLMGVFTFIFGLIIGPITDQSFFLKMVSLLYFGYSQEKEFFT